MKLFSKIILLMVISCFTASPLYAQQDIKGAIVKVYTVYNEHDYGKPWQMLGQQRRSGSGCIISGKRILTNAHVVGDQMFIQVKRAGQAKKYTAEVEAVAHECDLAILKVADDSFFAGAQPLEIGSLVEARDKVAVYGFPMGGDELCITEGVVSRVECQYYSHSGAILLACQIDAAINPGSSGGPVIKNDKIVGVAFQAAEGENIGYMVPTSVINHFLKDIQDGDYDGIPLLGINFQHMENINLRLRYNMQEGQSGVLINKVYPSSCAKGILESGDVLLSIDGKNIENNATIEFRNNERVFFSYLIRSKYIGEAVDLKILRKGRVKNVQVILTTLADSCRLVPYQQYDVSPTYYIIGGLIFQPLTLNYLQMWNIRDAPANLVNYLFYGQPSEERRQIVVLTGILANEANVGYEGFEDSVISQVNSRKISTIKDLVSAIEGNKKRYHIFVNELGKQIILDKNGLEEISKEILEKYNIDSDRSEDL